MLVTLRVPARDVERLGGVRERVQGRATALLAREPEGQLGLVDDPRQVCADATALHAPVGVAHAEECRPLGARVGGRHRDEAEAGRRRDRLGEVDRAATADGEEAVRPGGGRGRLGHPVARHLVPAAGRGHIEPRPALACNQERPLDPELGEQRRELVEPPADDHSRVACELEERFGRTCRRSAGGANERDLPRGVEPLHASGLEGAGREIGLDRGARDEGDAVAGGDGRLHGLLQAELETGLEVAQPRAGATQLVLDHLAHARALLHHDQRLLAQLVERDRPPGEAVARRARRARPRPGRTARRRRRGGAARLRRRRARARARRRDRPPTACRRSRGRRRPRGSRAGTRRGARARRCCPAPSTRRPRALPRSSPCSPASSSSISWPSSASMRWAPR